MYSVHFTLHATVHSYVVTHLFKIHVLYTICSKTFEGENFHGFGGFLANREIFPLNHLLCTVHNGMGLMHRKSFPVNSVFCVQPQVFPLESFAVYGIATYS